MTPSAIRHPLSAIRYPLSAIRYPLSAIRYRAIRSEFASGVPARTFPLGTQKNADQ
jgi:hypothetical protein